MNFILSLEIVRTKMQATISYGEDMLRRERLEKDVEDARVVVRNKFKSSDESEGPDGLLTSPY